MLEIGSRLRVSDNYTGVVRQSQVANDKTFNRHPRVSSPTKLRFFARFARNPRVLGVAPAARLTRSGVSQWPPGPVETHNEFCGLRTTGRVAPENRARRATTTRVQVRTRARRDGQSTRCRPCHAKSAAYASRGHARRGLPQPRCEPGHPGAGVQSRGRTRCP